MNPIFYVSALRETLGNEPERAKSPWAWLRFIPRIWSNRNGR